MRPHRDAVPTAAIGARKDTSTLWLCRLGKPLPLLTHCHFRIEETDEKPSPANASRGGEAKHTFWRYPYLLSASRLVWLWQRLQGYRDENHLPRGQRLKITQTPSSAPIDTPSCQPLLIARARRLYTSLTMLSASASRKCGFPVIPLSIVRSGFCLNEPWSSHFPSTSIS